MEKIKRTFCATSFALFALCFLAYSIFAAAVKHYDWLYISIPLIIVYILCFLAEVIKISELSNLVKPVPVGKNDLSPTLEILRQKQVEITQLETEIMEDEKRKKILDQEIEELSEEVDVAALEKK